MGFDYIVSDLLLPPHCGFFFISLDVEYIFWYVPIFFIDGSSAVSCDFGVLVRGGELKVILLCCLFESNNTLFIYIFTSLSIQLLMGTTVASIS